VDNAKRKQIEKILAATQTAVDEILKKKQLKESLPKESVREMAKEAAQLAQIAVEIAKKKQQRVPKTKKPLGPKLQKKSSRNFCT